MVLVYTSKNRHSNEIQKQAHIELIQKLKTGDKHAFEEFVIQYQKKVYYFVYKYFNNEEEVKDISQEIFIKIYKNIKYFKEDSSLNTWVYKIMHNTCTDEYRRRSKRNGFIASFLNHSDQLDTVIDTSTRTNPEKNAELNETRDQLKKCVQSLPPRQRDIIILKVWEELKIREIAQILNCSDGTIKANLFKAYKNLRKIYKPYMEMK